MSRNRDRDQQIWVEYELFKDDWKGQVTSEQLFQFLARRHFANENPESAFTKVKKIVENMRKADKNITRHCTSRWVRKKLQNIWAYQYRPLIASESEVT